MLRGLRGWSLAGPEDQGSAGIGGTAIFFDGEVGGGRSFRRR